jgi:CRISPR-associated protein Cas5t
MREILFIHLFQPFAQFRNPFTFFYAQTFPLPPKSTILGFLENATSKYYSGTFDNIKVSIWGYNSSIYWNYLRFIKGNPYIDDKGIVRAGDKKPLYGFSPSQRTPTYQQEILGLNLFLFLREDNDEQKLNELKDVLSNIPKVVYLGRGEDVVFIRGVRFLEIDKELEKKSLKDFYLKIGTYIKINLGNEGYSFSFKKFPVYSIPLVQKFVYKDNEDKSISTRQELLSKKDKLKRKVIFEPVLYAEDKRVILPQTYEVIKFKYNDSNVKEINFYLIENLSWL